MKRLLYSISSCLVIKWWLVPYSVDTSAEAVSGNIESGGFAGLRKIWDHVVLATKAWGCQDCQENGHSLPKSFIICVSIGDGLCNYLILGVSLMVQKL
jgi:hypothetical protein